MRSFFFFSLLFLFLVLASALHSQGQTVNAQSGGISPTFGCMGSPSSICPPPTNAGTVAPTNVGTTNAPGTTSAPGVTNLPGATSTPTVTPCESETVNVATSGRKKHKLRGDSQGLFWRFLQIIIEFLNRLLQLIGGGGNIPLPNPGGSGDPCPTITPNPTNVPSGTIAPTSGSAPTGTSGTSPSGEAMPVGDLPGWQMIFSDDFTTNVPVGSFPGTVYGPRWDVYEDGTPDTAGNQGKPSRYYPSKVVSVKDGLLYKYLHTENGTPMAAAIYPKATTGKTYGRYVIRFKADSLQGFKTAWLLWPDVGDWDTGGEIDFPEGDLDSNINAYFHPVGGGEQDAFDSKQKYTSWHTAVTEWTAGKVVFILDGKTIGTSTRNVPNKSMSWIIQSESCLSESGCPAPSVAGNILIDWVAAYVPK